MAVGQGRRPSDPDSMKWRRLMRKFGLVYSNDITQAEKNSLLKMENDPSFIPKNLERFRAKRTATRTGLPGRVPRSEVGDAATPKSIPSAQAPAGRPKRAGGRGRVSAPSPTTPSPAGPTKKVKVDDALQRALDNQEKKPVKQSPKPVKVDRALQEALKTQQTVKDKKPPAKFRDRPDALDIPSSKVSKPKSKAPDKKLETSLAAARKKGDLYYSKKGKKMAAVTKEDLEKSGLSLRDYLNEKLGLTRRESKPPRPKRKPAQKAYGGMMKPKKMMGGGMAGKKPRMGHMDYRKGGMVYNTTKG